MAKMYLGGCSGIEKPVDMNGIEIKVGDKLSWDYGDDDTNGNKPDEWMVRPIFIVKNHTSGKGLFAQGIHKELYLHDFRFKYCQIKK